MAYNIKKQIKTLELDKLLARLADCCGSAEGAEAARGLNPAVDFKTASGRLEDTGAAYTLSVKGGSPSFDGLCMPEEMLLRAKAGGGLMIPELLRVAGLLRSLRRLGGWRRDCGIPESRLDSLFEQVRSNKSLEDRITSSVANEEELADDASPLLYDIRRKKRQALLSVRERLESIVRSTGYSKYLQESLVTQRDGRYVVPVKAEYRSNVPGLVHGVSASGSTLFIEPMPVVEANNEIRVLEGKEAAETERILAELSALCGDAADTIIESAQAAVRLDVIFARAALGIAQHAYLPVMGQDGVIDIKKARHPLIDPAVVVPVDIRLGGDFDLLVITGPNTGGKTVALKTLGLFCMMALCGLMLPAAEGSRISWFNRILADIGDEQSIEQSLSTFSAHTTNIISILAQTDDKSLVLLDEVGAGTDPTEGAALAIAILEHLRAKKAKIAATTHYAEIKLFALDTPRVKNASCEFDVESLRPTFKLLIGVPGSSNAFAISRRLGLPEEIILHAGELVEGKVARLEDVMGALEIDRQHMERARAEAETHHREAAAAHEAAEEATRKAEATAQKELDRLRADNARLIGQIRYETDRLLEQIAEMKKDKNADPDELARRARNEIEVRIRELEKKAGTARKTEFGEPYQLPRPLKIGDKVKVTDMDSPGSVIALPDNSGYVQLQMGIMKVRVPVDRVRLEDKKSGAVSMPKQTIKPRTAVAGGVSIHATSRSERAADSTLDLRGQTVDEGVVELDSFIDNAVMSGLSLLTIIHGKGTGALKKGVVTYLKSNPSIASFRPGRYGEGEDGVTIVELKSSNTN